MDTIGLDLHKRESQLCILTDDGELIERRIVTSRARFSEVLGSRPPARILLEASTESEWVARHLESHGHTVVVADPGFAPMYATRSKRVKTDKRDARTLCDALTLGAYRGIHRASDAQRHIRAELAVRDALVRTRTRYVAMIKAFVRREGLRLPSGEVEGTEAKLAQLVLPLHTTQQLAPLVALLAPINAEIDAADARLLGYSKDNPVVGRLRTMPGIGPVTAIAFVAALDDVARFQNAHQVQAYLGLVPSEFSSGDRQVRGHITKRGDARLRWLLVEAAWRILRSPNPELAALKAWAEQIAARRGRRIAVIALARRLAGILYAMWRDGADFRSRPVARAA
ncbi:MAG TPA: IS110 family transposase [Gemmatimonadaceae bacterium]|nr:IS110 family transposase [Gemmatimonadaceae bacterium]